MNSLESPDHESTKLRSKEPHMGGINVLVVMGVSGSGKTTIAREFARVSGWKFADADHFHTPQNIRKMTAGIPLSDSDRSPWLENLRDFLKKSAESGTRVALACSALKRNYRESMSGDQRQVRWAYLHGEFDLIMERIRRRKDHFMNPCLLRSQFESLEAPADAIRCDIRLPVTELVAHLRKAIIPELNAPCATASEVDCAAEFRRNVAQVTRR